MTIADRAGSEVGQQLGAEAYDSQWAGLADFIRYNPGARHRRRLIRSLLRGIPCTSLLDVGCGRAELLGSLRGYVSEDQYTGTDLSPYVIDENTKRFPSGHFTVLDIEKQSLGSTFDVVVCSEVLEHLSLREAAVRNLAAMVRPGGYLLITCPTGRMYPTEIAWGHVSHPTQAELDALSSAAGLSLVKALCWGFPLYTLTRFATNLRPAWSAAHFGTGKYTTMAKAICHALYAVNFLNLSESRYGCQLTALYRSA